MQVSVSFVITEATLYMSIISRLFSYIQNGGVGIMAEGVSHIAQADVYMKPSFN